MTDLPDHTIGDVRRESRERFLRLLETCSKRLEDFAFAMTRDSDEACDLVAETVLRAFESFGTLRDEGAFLSYLFTIAGRVHRRRRLRARWFGPFDAEAAERIRSHGTMPDVAADVRLLYQALDALPVKQREAVVLFEISGLSLKDVQAIQGGSIASIKVRLHRARKRLAELLGVADAPMPSEATSAVRRGSHARRDLSYSIDVHINE